jgi:hypothetical protein
MTGYVESFFRLSKLLRRIVKRGIFVRLITNCISLNRINN